MLNSGDFKFCQSAGLVKGPYALHPVYISYPLAWKLVGLDVHDGNL